MPLVGPHIAQLLPARVTRNEKADDRYTSYCHALLFDKHDATFYKGTESRQGRYNYAIFFQYNDPPLWQI